MHTKKQRMSTVREACTKQRQESVRVRMATCLQVPHLLPVPDLSEANTLSAVWL